MANISDIIEQFILEAMAEGNRIEIGRNELASYFSVSPSQINYVLSTRFSVDRGYIIDSRRGGGGYIIVERLDTDSINDINIGDTLTFREGVNIINRLLDNNIITLKDSAIIKAAISDKALNNPFNITDSIRAQLLKEIIIKLMINKE
ncbi:MAG: CtsR family transcriptional regulator [Christensenellales bacterium]|jgi:transcriptional regulator CtsR